MQFYHEWNQDLSQLELLFIYNDGTVSIKRSKGFDNFDVENMNKILDWINECISSGPNT